MKRPAPRDLAIGLAVAAGLLVELATSERVDGDLTVDAPLYAAAGLALCWRRAAPIASAVGGIGLAALATVAGTDVTDLVFSMLFLVLPAYAIGHEVTDRRAYGALAAIIALVALVTEAAEELTADDAAFPVGIQIASFTCGRLLRTRLEMNRTLADETARLEVDRELRAQAAVGEERARIAREMHDVVAHTMAIMVVQAGAARSVLARDAAAAEASLATVEETGRTALTELRRMLGFLREDAPAALAPQPGLADVRSLVARGRDAGLRIELREEGERFELPSGAELAAYRIVQEALTNTLKHAGPGTLATVSVLWQPDGLEVAVVDGGGTGKPSRPPAGSGHGLMGMQERVAMYGGEVQARPRSDGGFLVRARIPREEVTA